MNKIVTRINNRLKEYDYSQAGVYFITICTKDKQHLLWKPNCVASCGCPPLSEIGNIINAEIKKIEAVYDNVKIDNYVIMPNHIHMLIELEPYEDSPTISRVINQFKGSVTKQIGCSVWQKLFHDHIIRGQDDYNKIYQYIDYNPIKWEDDCYFVK